MEHFENAFNNSVKCYGSSKNKPKELYVADMLHSYGITRPADKDAILTLRQDAILQCLQSAYNAIHVISYSKKQNAAKDFVSRMATGYRIGIYITTWEAL